MQMSQCLARSYKVAGASVPPRADRHTLEACNIPFDPCRRRQGVPGSCKRRHRLIDPGRGLRLNGTDLRCSGFDDGDMRSNMKRRL